MWRATALWRFTALATPPSLKLSTSSETLKRHCHRQAVPPQRTNLLLRMSGSAFMLLICHVPNGPVFI